jgi:glycine/D-amino acid oxidase-like deaminating enzyme
MYEFRSRLVLYAFEEMRVWEFISTRFTQAGVSRRRSCCGALNPMQALQRITRRRPAAAMLRTAGCALSTAAASNFDVVIVGGGVVGLSAAFHIAEKSPGASVCVVEKDSTYTKASAVLSAGGIRQQFSGAENIAMSLYGIDFIRNTERLKVDGEDLPDMQFMEGGYLFLGPERSVGVMQENNAVQHEMGCDWIHLLPPDELKATFPWLMTDDLALGSYGTKNEGWFDPWSLISSLRQKVKTQGVTIVQGNVTGMHGSDTSGEIGVESVLVETEPGTTVELGCGKVVNAAGAWADDVMQMALGIRSTGTNSTPFPVRARKRSVFMFHCNDTSVSENCPLTVDPSGVWFRREGSGSNGNSQCTHYALTMHPLCTHYALTMHPLCTHYAPTMHPLCTHYAPTMHPLCTHYAPTMHSLYTHYAPTIHPLYTHYALCR